MVDARPRRVLPIDLSNVEFEMSEEVDVIPTFDNMGLREDLLRGIYAYAIDFKELRSKLHSKEILLIDVRSRRENKEEGSIPGSVNIPLSELGNTLLLSSEEFQEQIGIPKPRNNMHLVVMCLLGARGQTAQLAFIGAGYTNIRLYPGSFADWKENDGELEFQVYDNFP